MALAAAAPASLCALLARPQALAAAGRLFHCWASSGAYCRPSAPAGCTQLAPAGSAAAAAHVAAAVAAPLGLLSLVQPQRHCSTVSALAAQPPSLAAFAIFPPATSASARGTDCHATAALHAAAAVWSLGFRYSVPDPGAFIRAVQKLRPARQHCLLEHADEVAGYMRGQGIDSQTVARVLQHCPALFSRPAQQRAAPLLQELVGGRFRLLPAQAVEVFVRCPALGNTRNVMPTIVRLVAEQQGVVWA